MSRQHEAPHRQDRITLIISGGRLLDPSIPAGTFRNVGDELTSLYGSDWLDDRGLLRRLRWLDRNFEPVFPDAPESLSALSYDVSYAEPLKWLDRLGTRAATIGLSRIQGFVPGAPFDHVGYNGSAEGLAANLRAAGIEADVRKHHFTRDEHAVLSAYLEQWPEEAAESLGASPLPQEVVEAYADQLASSEYGSSPTEAAVAAIVLRSVHKELPWCGSRARGPESGARWRRPRRKDSAPSVLPIRLLTINWASSGPGLDWPEAYYLSWVPVYDRYVITVSADSEETLRGHIDMAIHSFAAGRDLLGEMKPAIVADWNMERSQLEQGRWAKAYSSGLVSEQLAEEWADEVWVEEDDEEEEEEEVEWDEDGE
jgi:hypothetical protein